MQQKKLPDIKTFFYIVRAVFKYAETGKGINCKQQDNQIFRNFYNYMCQTITFLFYAPVKVSAGERSLRNVFFPEIMQNFPNLVRFFHMKIQAKHLRKLFSF